VEKREAIKAANAAAHVEMRAMLTDKEAEAIRADNAAAHAEVRQGMHGEEKLTAKEKKKLAARERRRVQKEERENSLRKSFRFDGDTVVDGIVTHDLGSCDHTCTACFAKHFKKEMGINQV
jgi:hypothetical protein